MRVRLKNVSDAPFRSISNPGGFHNPGESWIVEWNERLNIAFFGGDLHRFGIIVTEIISDNKMLGIQLGIDPRVAARITDSSRILEAILHEEHAGQPEEILLDKLSRVEQFTREAQDLLLEHIKKEHIKKKTRQAGRKHISPLGETIEDGE